MLTEADLAMMRETQALTRPTDAELVRVTQGTTPSGGRGNVEAEPEPIKVRLDGREKEVPAQVTAVVGGGKAVKIVMDLVEVRSGDIIRVGASEFLVVTDGDPDEWATAQVVWTRQTKAPGRASQ